MLPYFVNKSYQFENSNKYVLKITSVRDEDYHISITDPDGGYQVMVVPGKIFEKIMLNFFSGPGSELKYPEVEPLNEKLPSLYFDAISNK